MDTRRTLSLALTLLLGCGSSGVEAPSAAPLTERPVGDVVAIVNARVITMRTPVVATNATVLIDHGRIVAVGATASMTIPASATTIDAKGRWLIPGLIDAHVHMNATDAPVYVRSGITSVRNMWGTPAIHAAQTLGDSSAMLGDVSPAIYSASPGIDANPPSWPYTQILENALDADSMVAALAHDGWRFLKVYNRLSPEVYDSVMASARRRGIRAIGHVPFSVSVEHAMSEGQAGIEHLTGFDRALAHGQGGALAWAQADLSDAPRLAALARDAGVWVCPTLVVLEAISSSADGGTRATARTRRQSFVRALHDAHARVLAGTDAGIDLTAPGTSLHDELESLVASGFTPYEALAAATTAVAEFLGQSGTIGEIREGARADLVLLRANPLENISATRAIDGVMLRGRWMVR